MAVKIVRSPRTDQPNGDMTPSFVEGWQQARPGRNTFYETLDGQQAVVLNTAGWRTGVLRLFFARATWQQSLAAALDAETQHRRRGTFTYTDSVLGGIAAMTYAVAGDVALYPTDSRTTWRLDVPFREL